MRLLAVPLLLLVLWSNYALARPPIPQNLSEEIDHFVLKTLPNDSEQETARSVERQPNGYWVVLLDVGYIGGNGTKQYVAVFAPNQDAKTRFQLLGARECLEGEQVVGIKNAIRKGKYGELVLRLQTIDTMEEYGKPGILKYRINPLATGGGLDYLP